MSKLAEKMRERIMSRGLDRADALDTLLSLKALDPGEFIIFQREVSLLSWKIEQRLEHRTPEETLKSLLATAKKAYCHACFELSGRSHKYSCPYYVGL